MIIHQTKLARRNRQILGKFSAKPHFPPKLLKGCFGCPKLPGTNPGDNKLYGLSVHSHAHQYTHIYKCLYLIK